jgi:NADPH:quinone reductase-like Zn-dependent oxidoreductase
VVGLGPGVDDGLGGRRVVIIPSHTHGTWAEHAVVAADAVVAAGEAGDPLQLAMAAGNPVTALLLLRRYEQLEPGDWIALTGANCSVGQHVVQLAKRRGIKTFNIVRREAAAEEVSAAGGDAVFVTDDGAPARLRSALDGRTLALVLDSVGGPAVTELAHHLRPGGKVVSYGAIAGEPTALAVRDDLIYRDISHHGFWMVNWLRQTPRNEIRTITKEVIDLISDGRLSAGVDATYRLDDHVEALARAQRYQRAGKVLFTPSH